MSEEEIKIKIDNVFETLAKSIKAKDKEIEKLKEDLEYSNHCEEQMRKTITNLEYKITTLEEQLKEVKKSE